MKTNKERLVEIPNRVKATWMFLIKRREAQQQQEPKSLTRAELLKSIALRNVLERKEIMRRNSR